MFFYTFANMLGISSYCRLGKKLRKMKRSHQF